VLSKAERQHKPREAAEEINSTSSPPNQIETDDGRKNQQHRRHVKYHQNSTLQMEHIHTINNNNNNNNNINQ